MLITPHTLNEIHTQKSPRPSRGQNEQGFCDYALRITYHSSTGQRPFGAGSLLREHQAVSLDANLDWLALVERSFEDFLCERVLERTLDRAAHWARAVLRVIATADQKVLCLVIELQHDIAR